MEEDDEFGDLYTDVLRPLTASFQTPDGEVDVPAAARNPASSSAGHRSDISINSHNEKIQRGAPDMKISNSSSGLGLKLVQERTLAEPSFRPESEEADFKFDSASEILAGTKTRGSEYDDRVLEKVEGVRPPQEAHSFMEADDDDINIVLEERDNRDNNLVFKDNNAIINSKENMFNSAAEKENTLNILNGTQKASETKIPGRTGRLENDMGANFEDEWESESEDDLQIVLNDNHHGPPGMEGMSGVDDYDDEDGEPLVIVADNGDVVHHHQQQQQQIMMGDQEWAADEGGHGPEGERKDTGAAAKATGGLGTAAQAAVHPRTGFGNQAYHHQFHSQFKYVRPGAAPIPGTAPGTQVASQVCPPVPMGPSGGRGRGDWRPTGLKGAMPMQKGFSPIHGVPGSGVNSVGRGYGSGLDFTLPSHKTIFEVDIDCFEEKPWKLPGIEVSDFFNFGLNEESWKDYRRRLEQLRLETTMQSKIRVYERGRVSQDYDPDLPPELAAAAGMQDILSESANPGKIDACPTEVARANAHGRPPLPTGRPIPVDSGSGDRLPSIDTRRPRMHDIDAIIEVICHSSKDEKHMADQQDNDPAGEVVEEIDEVDDLKQDDVEHVRRIRHAYNSQKKELVAKRAHLKNSIDGNEIVMEDAVRFPSAKSMQYQPDEETGVPQEARSTKGKVRTRSPEMTASHEKRGLEIMDYQGKESFGSGSCKQSPSLSPACTIGSDGEQTPEVRDDKIDESVKVDRSFDVEREEKTVDEKTRNTFEVGDLVHSTNIQKSSSREEQLSQDNDDKEDSKAAGSSENSKSRSETSKDHHKFHESVADEVLQGRRPPLTSDIKRAVGNEDYARRRGHHERDEAGRKHIPLKGREDSTSHRGGDPNSSVRHNVKIESSEWRKQSEVSERSLHSRDGDHQGRRNRFEDTRKMEHGGEISSRSRGKVRESERIAKEEHYQSRNQLDKGGFQAVNHDQDMGSRQRHRNYNLKSLSEKVDVQSRKRKEGAHRSWEDAADEDIYYNNRETSSRRKRERDDGPDQWKRDDQARLENDDLHYVRQKDGGSFQRERSDRQRDHDEWDSLKQSHEELLLRKERGETRSMMRNGRDTEDKVWNNHSRGKDEYRGSSREYYPKESGRHSDHLKRRSQVEYESFSQQRGHEDLYARGDQLKHDERRARNEKPHTHSERVPYATGNPRLHEHKQIDSSGKGKDSESVHHGSLVPSTRNQDEHGGQISHTVNLRGRTQQEGENEIRVNRQSARKPKEEDSSDDEQPDKRGRSKLQRWTSHKDSDFSITPLSSSSIKTKVLNTSASRGASSVAILSEDPSEKAEDMKQPPADDKETGPEINNINPKVIQDKHLDTVAKLKKRSERFKLPMPREKDSAAIKKIGSEPLPSAQNEISQDSEIKPERPARKRRWTGS